MSDISDASELLLIFGLWQLTKDNPKTALFWFLVAAQVTTSVLVDRHAGHLATGIVAGTSALMDIGILFLCNKNTCCPKEKKGDEEQPLINPINAPDPGPSSFV